VAADKQACQDAVDNVRVADDHLADFTLNAGVGLAELIDTLGHRGGC
jgi:hypothetical protein